MKDLLFIIMFIGTLVFCYIVVVRFTQYLAELENISVHKKARRRKDLTPFQKWCVTLKSSNRHRCRQRSS